MKKHLTLLAAALTTGFLTQTAIAQVLTQGIVPVVQYNALANNSNTPYSDLYPDANFVAGTPAERLFIVGVDAVGTNPNQDNFGRVLEFLFRPPRSGMVRFYVRSDDGSDLFVSPDSTIPTDLANALPVATEEDCCQPFQEGTAAVNPGAKPGYDTITSSTESEPISVTAGVDVGMAFVYKDGTGGDFGQVAVRYEDDPTPAGQLQPISPEYIYGWVDPTGHSSSITQQPADTSGEDGKTATFSVVAEAVPATDPIGYQWLRDGVIISGANAASYTTPVLNINTDDGAKFQVKLYTVAGPVMSDEATLTVTPDVTAPELVGLSAAVNRTEVTLVFSERMGQASAETTANYVINGGALAVTAATLSADETSVTLTTATQNLGMKYTILINDVLDASTTGNPIAADTKAVFFAVGAIQEIDGFVVFEVENYDDILGALWTKDTVIANASGGAYMRLPDNVGDNEANDQLLYNVAFAQTATYQVWYHASVGDSVDTGAADSGWFHLDGARPAERAASNDASMTGFNDQRQFVWRSDAQSGSDPFTVDITAGDHVVGIAAREDGAHFDKMILTTDTSFAPTGFGPPETREGSPGVPTISISSPTDGQTFPTGTDVIITPEVAGQSGLEVVRVEYTANNVVIGESTTSPFGFTWSGVRDGIYRISATVTDEINQTTSSTTVQITVGTPPPQVLFVVNSGNPPIVNASDGLIQNRLESFGFQLEVVGSDFDDVSMATGKDLVILSSTFGSGNVSDTYKNVAVPVINWEQAVQDDMAWTTVGGSADRGTTAGQTGLEIVDPTHPLAAGLPAGVVEVVTAPTEFAWGQPNANANAVAQLVGTSNYGIYGYETGALLTDNTPAAARRVMLFLTDNAASALTDDGWKLVDAAISWALDRTITVSPEFDPPALAGSTVTISWTGAGILEQAPSVTGPWSAAPSQANPQSVAAAGTTFYRIKQ